MAETAQHKQEVARLVHWLEAQGVQVTHAVGEFALPDPPAHGRHEPDAVGSSRGVLWIGEAKTGNGDLGTPHTYEQLFDFSRREMKGGGVRCPFILCVPKGATDDAYAALRAAGADLSNTTVIS